jgi:hypothetical protein
VWHSRTGKGGVREGNDRFFVDFRQRRKVLSLGVVLYLVQLGSDFVGVVAVALGVAQEGAVLQAVFVMSLGSVLSS